MSRRTHDRDAVITIAPSRRAIPSCACRSGKIVIAGDLLVNPISFALSSYPAGWLRTLEADRRAGADVIVPGHGCRCATRCVLRTTMEVMRVLLDEGKRAKARGLDAMWRKRRSWLKLHDQDGRLDPRRAGPERSVQTYLVDWYLHRVYDELDAPLTDAIATIPPK